MTTNPSNDHPTFGTLYIVATPIGNLEDITLRALRIMKEVTLIACEDTRHTRKLLTHYDIHTVVESYHRHNEVSKAQQLVQRILSGDDVALVSDAGVPCISDPGYNLVACAHAAGIMVRSIPGPSAVTAALSISGLKADNFLFMGFVSSKKSERRRVLKSLKMSSSLLVFYESPHRLRAFLKDCLDLLGNRPVAICKEITKIFEQCFKGDLLNVLTELSELSAIKGEYVVLLEGIIDKDEPPTENLTELLVWYRDNAELSLKDCVKKITSDLGLSRSEVYAKALGVWGKR